MIAAPSGWATFYVFSQHRGADWGSIWYLFEYYSVPKLGNYQLSTLNKMSAAVLIVAFAAIALLALAAPRRPRLPQLCFLLLAAFLITNKVWSPQYVIWLVPLAVLARPRCGRTSCGSWPRSGTSSASGATSSSSYRQPGPRRDRLPGHQHRLVLRRCCWPGSSP